MKRFSVNEDDLLHLMRGGTLDLGDVQLVLHDLGYEGMECCLIEAKASTPLIGEVKTASQVLLDPLSPDALTAVSTALFRIVAQLKELISEMRAMTSLLPKAQQEEWLRRHKENCRRLKIHPVTGEDLS